MKKSQNILVRKRANQRGFTLVEMLVVAALIAIFAGLAVFNITAQLEREKSKAVVAEARQIATAMSFAYDDLGFFPKIGLLKYNVDNLFDYLKGTGFDSAEYHSYIVGNQDVRLRKQWKQNYMSTGGPDKFCTMHFTSNGVSKDLTWPADQWGEPYVGYFIKTVPAVGNNPPTQKFIENAGEKPNYAAAIVSYGRNRVPGLTINSTSAEILTRMDGRLYTDTVGAGPKQYDMIPANKWNTVPDQINFYVGSSGGAPQFPNAYIREPNSDDRFYEF